MALTHERLTALLHYDPGSGVFTWRVTRSRMAAAGQRAGYTQHGRRNLKVDGGTYKASRLAWFYMMREWPARGLDVDHEDRDSLNDRWLNLRLLTRSGNGQNSLSPRHNASSGLRGVTWHAASKQWRARITHGNGERRHLGLFPTAEAAYTAYLAAKTEAHPSFSTTAPKGFHVPTARRNHRSPAQVQQTRRNPR